MCWDKEKYMLIPYTGAQIVIIPIYSSFELMRTLYYNVGLCENYFQSMKTHKLQIEMCCYFSPTL